MCTTEPLNFSPPEDLADIMKKKLQSGENASESEVIRDGLRALHARDPSVESWLVQQVAPAWDALKADPSRALSPDEVRARLAAAYVKAR